MASPLSSVSSTEATQLLKDILNVGKRRSTDSPQYPANMNGSTPLTSLSYETSASLTTTVPDGEDREKFDEILRQLSNSSTKQQILLQGTDTSNSFSVYGQEVDVISSTASGASQPSAGSNKVKISPAVNYDWEHKYYLGNLVAAHKSGIYIAYVLKGKSGGVIRVINRRTAERSLLKGFVGRVVDISFAYISQVILGAVDERGNLFIYEITEPNGRTIQSELLLHITRPDVTTPSDNHRLIWCPYIPEEENDNDDDSEAPDDVGKLLVLTHESQIEMWHVDLVIKEHGSGSFQPSEINLGFLSVEDHKEAVVDASFSPDGTALATASLDGEVKVFQVYMMQNTPARRLHMWKPHDGKPLSCLSFLDNYKDPQAQFWKFAITGADHNREIKIWSCESWTCLQTLRFYPPPNLPSNFQVDPCLKMSIDLSSKYVVLSDVKRRVLYVIEIHQDWEAGRAHICSISEFLLTQPCLSFAILDAGRKKFKKISDTGGVGEIDEEDDENVKDYESETQIGNVLRMFSVHTKALQELTIQYQPESSVPAPPMSISSMSQDEASFRDPLTDVSMDTLVSEVESSVSQRSLDNGQPLLLTPDAFTATPRKGDMSALDSYRSSLSASSSFTQVTAMNEGGMSPLGQPAASPSSSVTMTPTQLDASPSVANPDEMPLPPATPGEENALNRSYQQSPAIDPIGSPRIGDTYPSVAVLTSSPRVQSNLLQNVDLLASTGQSEELAKIDDMFNSTEEGTTQRPPLVSTGSSSSASLEVSEILNYNKKSEVLQETSPKPSTGDEASPRRPDHFIEDSSSSRHVDQFPPAPTTEPSRPYDNTIWPRPPDLSTEAKRLVEEALKKTGVEPEKDADGDDEDEGDDEDDDDMDGDDDVKVEEEEIAEVEPIPVRKALSHDSQVKRVLERTPVTVHTAGSGDAVTKPTVDSQKIDMMVNTLSEVLIQIKNQQDELSALRREVKNQHQIQQSLQQLQRQVQTIEGSMHRHVDSVMDNLSKDQQAKWLELSTERQTQEKQRQEKLVSAVTRSVNSSVSAKLENVVKNEIRTTVLPTITKMIDPIKEQLHNEMAQKLTATDTLMKESINKLVRSKSTIDAIGQATSNAIQGPIQATYRDAFQTQVVPTFERACQTMFHQVNESFQRGTKEYMHQMEIQLDRLRKKQQEARDPALTQLQSSVDTFQVKADNLQDDVAQKLRSDLDTSIKGAMFGLQESLFKHINTVVKEEIVTAMREHQASISDSVLQAMRSGAVTPVPISSDPLQTQAHLLGLLEQGQLNAAFQQALTASDLNLVMLVCEAVDPSQVFNQTPCPLQQPVLLSLIQQLSADLIHNTELKRSYLEEAITNLDTSNTLTREHMPNVLSNLTQKLQTFITTNPNHKMLRQMKMLLLASNSLSR